MEFCLYLAFCHLAREITGVLFDLHGRILHHSLSFASLRHGTLSFGWGLRLKNRALRRASWVAGVRAEHWWVGIFV